MSTEGAWGFSTEFASQAALALVLADAQQSRQRLAVFEDRDRIARDLHDLVVQRLFATGMMLESTRRRDWGAPDGARRRHDGRRGRGPDDGHDGHLAVAALNSACPDAPSSA